MTISNAAQFGLLLWKHWLIQKRRIVLSLCLILLPAVFPTFLLLGRLVATSEFVSQPTIRDSFDASQLPPKLTGKPYRTVNGSKTDIDAKWMLVFSPNTSRVVTRIATETAKTLNMTSLGNELTCLFATRDIGRQR